MPRGAQSLARAEKRQRAKERQERFKTRRPENYSVDHGRIDHRGHVP